MIANQSVHQTAIVDADTDWTTGVVPKQRHEVVSGYVLEQRIGAGAYGEVWRAVGPGGLPKAVKILHGRHDGPQADAELRSLERMRGLQHPFLVNIERIEIDDGRLIIVTELAERSLEARFEQRRSEGHRAIARDELLAYLRDAADALDFLWERHGLQHLDVKPGNLLLQGDHLKVADFGLIKDVRHTSVSLIGGFTPLYAPPELFEGRPSRTSDQYSLAIVYQMMLTGVPPFSGRTAAQLTAQHLHSKPDLTALPLSDRPAVMRALAKNPEARFDSCRQFIDRLSARKPRGGPPRDPAGQPGPPAANQHGATGPSAATGRSDTTKVRSELARRESRPLAPVDGDPSQVTYRPTLMIGIGGLAGHVLRGLRRRFAERFGDASSLPALPMLYIDTDPQAIAAGRAVGDGCRFERDETLLIPLRDPQEYRSDSETLLRWLSRRWLYNIPRSRRVEGIRPLGRLAFVDHQQAVRARIGQRIDDATNDEALQRTHRATGLPLAAGPPDVVLVAAISGGTGSGAVLDAAYLVRDVLAEKGFEPADFSGLLLHGTGTQPQSRQLEVANTVACLRELAHFAGPGGGYPGDAAFQLPPCNGSPFDHAYVIHLGDGREPAGLAAEADKVAEYLYRSTATPARAFFQDSRRGVEDGNNHDDQVAGLRTFGVGTLGEHLQTRTGDEVEALCAALVRRWHGHPAEVVEVTPAATAGLAEHTTALLGRLRLSAEDLGAFATSMTQGELGKRVDAFFYARWEQMQTQDVTGALPPETLTDLFDADFLPACRDVQHADHPALIFRHFQQRLGASAQKCVLAIQADLLGLIDSHPARLDAGREALGDVVFRLNTALQQLSPMLDRIGNDLERAKRTAAQGTPPSGPDAAPPHSAGPLSDAARALHRRYCMLKFCEGIWRCWIDYLKTIRSAVSKTTAALASLDAQVRALEDHFGHTPSATPDNTPAEDGAEHPSGTLSPPVPPDDSMVLAFDDRLLSDGKVKLAELLSPQAEPTARAFADALRNEAFLFLADRADGQGTPTASAGNMTDEVEPLIEAITPQISAAGGGHRVLAVLPNQTAPGAWQQKLTDKFGPCVTTQQHACRDLFACCEVAGLAGDAIIDRLTSEQPTLLDMAFRLHTRIDVEWNPGQ